MVFAQGGVPVKHVTANDMPSPDTDVQRNDLAPDASMEMSDGGQDMGSLTGWQALANEVASVAVLCGALPYFAVPCCLMLLCALEA